MAPLASEAPKFIIAIIFAAGRLILCGIYAAIALPALIVNRQHILPALSAPFAPSTTRHGRHPHPAASPGH